MITYKATGIVLGNCWGGGLGGYKAETVIANTLPELERQILAGIADGSLDSGMGYESLIGAVMIIDIIDTREIGGKRFVAHDYEQNFYGELSKEQIEFLIEAADCI